MPPAALLGPGLVLALLAAALAAPPAAVAGGGMVQYLGAGLGKTYRPDCYAPATVEVVVDDGADVVRASTVNPCGAGPLGAVRFEHAFPFAACTFRAHHLACEESSPGARDVVHVGPVSHAPPPAASLVYLVQRGAGWVETLAPGVRLG